MMRLLITILLLLACCFITCSHAAETDVKYKVKTFATLPSNAAPLGITYSNNMLYVASSALQKVYYITNGGFSRSYALGFTPYPTSLQIVNDWLYFSNVNNIIKFNIADTAQFQTITTAQNTNLFVLSDDDYYYSNKAGNSIYHFSQQSTTQVATGTLNEPRGIYFRNNKLYFTETGADTVKMMYNNQVTTLASGVDAFDLYVTTDDIVFFTDYNNQLVYKIQDGKVSLIAGVRGSSGADYADDVDSLASFVSLPTGIAFDSLTGRIFFAESTSQRIRVLTPECPAGYFLNVGNSRCLASVCSGIDSSDSNVCSGRGTCNATSQCECQSNYFGVNCELTTCNGIASSSVQACSGNGTCENYNTCKCKPGYSGDSCQIAECFGNLSNQTESVCSGNGNCIAFDNCECKSGYSGSRCEIPSCFGIPANGLYTICNGNGNCILKDKCECKDGYFGEKCDVFYCNNQLYNSTLACSGNGLCNSPNSCKCTNGFFGSNCELFNCNGIVNNDTSTCSGHGVCVAKDTCQCIPGYLGNDCQLPKCYSIPSNDSSVCSGNGLCTSLDSCKCKDGYFGNRCEIPSCFGVLANNSDTCNGNGQCQRLNTCVCNSNYTGNSCSVPKCFGISANSNSACSGIGNCTKPDYCICPPYTSGFECQYVTTPRKLQTSNLPTVIVESVSTSLDFKIISAELRISDLQNSRKECGVDCDLAFSYRWTLNYGSEVFSSPYLSGYGKTKSLSVSTFQLTFSPVISVLYSRVFNSNVNFTLQIQSGGESVEISQEINIISPPVRTKGLVNILPNSGIALSTLFSIEENKSLWNVSSESRKYIEPFQFAFGFLYNQELIRISEFSINGKENLFLPYLNKNNSNGASENLEIYVICKDSLKNEYSYQIESVSLLPNLVNSTDELKTQVSGIANILPYDSSWKFRNLKEYSTVIVDSVSKIKVDLNNPSTSLTALKQLTTQSVSSTPEVGAVITEKLDNYLSSLNQIYQKEKETNGFVSSRLSNSDIKNTLESASNLLSFGYTNISNVCTQLTSVLLYQQSSKIIDHTFDYSKLSTDLINITITSFIKKSNTQSGSSQFSDISLDTDSILTKYNGFDKEIGLSLITYNSKLFNSSQTQLSTSKDFTLYMGGKAVSLSDLTQPIFISFSAQNLSSIDKKLVKCRFWNETTEKWDDNGCSLHEFNQDTGSFSCKCTHTTLFAAFVENSFNNTLIDQVALKEVSNLYIAQISFGVIFLILSTSLMIGLIVMRKPQPLASRFVTPFIGIFSLIVECVLLLITQRSILLSAQNGLNFSFIGGQLSESTVIQLENGDLAANIVSNIITIIVNSLTLTAMFSYLYQISRYHVLKHFYHRLFVIFAQNSNQNDRKMKLIRQLMSTKVMIAIMSGFLGVNILYWTLWVILVRSSAIAGTTYSYIVSISFTVIILLLGFMICGLILLDVVMTLSNIRKEKSMVNGNNQENASQSSNSLQSLQKIDKEATKKIAKLPLMKSYHWFIKIDSPLYFRGEMILFVICFVFLIISQIIGISGLSYKKGEKQSRVNDSLSLVFEILYLFTYLLVFGGYALLVRLSQFIQQKKKGHSTSTNQNEIDEMSQLLNNVEGLRLFEHFSEKEYSIENLHLFLEMKHKQELIQTGDSLGELYSFIDHVWSIYVQSNSIKEVNISSDCKRKFSNLRNSLSEMVKQNGMELKNKNSPPKELINDVQMVLSTLQDQITYNLSDTFSRFSTTEEYAYYMNVIESQQEMLSKSKLV